MENLELHNNVLIKEIIRYEEDMYLLNVEIEHYVLWDLVTSNLFVRADVGALSELLRLENEDQFDPLEDVLLNMLMYGEPPKVDILTLTGSHLKLKHSDIVIKRMMSEEKVNGVHDLPQLVDVFPKVKTTPLSEYLELEKEFSKEILENTFAAFQKTFALIDRGYTLAEASFMMKTDNPISALIYNKIKAQLTPAEEMSTACQHNEDRIEENYITDKKKILENVFA